ncbi:hypothetical protein NECAME_07509 [Necator americanus]|uniref:Uncharacterized protein n=1 Tax=Necator americanus TaxID=51031 RepID=W2TQ06_NECAM|nr:hypothetical protein NECAME_07509 [Necator americanus]ETN83211.1 hypothetical protein NECAME_07509 [Necator americanus]
MHGRIPLLCGIEDPDIIDCMRLVLACMMDTPAAEVSSLFLSDRRQSKYQSCLVVALLYTSIRVTGSSGLEELLGGSGFYRRNGT